MLDHFMIYPCGQASIKKRYETMHAHIFQLHSIRIYPSSGFQHHRNAKITTTRNVFFFYIAIKCTLLTFTTDKNRVEWREKKNARWMTYGHLSRHTLISFLLLCDFLRNEEKRDNKIWICLFPLLSQPSSSSRLFLRSHSVADLVLDMNV